VGHLTRTGISPPERRLAIVEAAYAP
jgi:hypothetical protein